MDKEEANPEQTTVAERLFYLPDPELRQQLEEYRIKFEAVHGPTDLSQQYTSMISSADQDRMLKNNPQRYFDGLPPFAQEYVRGKMQIAARKGLLDDTDDSLLRLYVSGGVKPDRNSGRAR